MNSEMIFEVISEVITEVISEFAPPMTKLTFKNQGQRSSGSRRRAQTHTQPLKWTENQTRPNTLSPCYMVKIVLLIISFEFGDHL